jgi:hypothetical protein
MKIMIQPLKHDDLVKKQNNKKITEFLEKLENTTAIRRTILLRYAIQKEYVPYNLQEHKLCEYLKKIPINRLNNIKFFAEINEIIT